MARERAAETLAKIVYDEDNWDISNPEKNKFCPGERPLINFSGRNWWVNYWCNNWNDWHGWWTYVWGGKSTTDPAFNSNFDPKQFFDATKKDTDGAPLLELKAFKPNGKDAWITSELVLEDLLGYGHYAITVKTTDFGNLDPWIVLGIFTYQYGEADPQIEANPHREIDLLETISTQQQGLHGNAQFALQDASNLPQPEGTNLRRFTIPRNTPYITVYMKRKDPHGSKEAKELDLRIYNGDHTLSNILHDIALKPFAEWNVNYASPGKDGAEWYKRIPLHTATSRERMHINWYVPRGGFEKGKPNDYNPDKAPKGPQSVYLKRFEFQAE